MKKVALAAAIVVAILLTGVGVMLSASASRERAGPIAVQAQGSANEQHVAPVATAAPAARDKPAATTAPAISDAQLRQGLVLEFTFDKDEANNRIVDASGSNNHGSATGTAWSSAGRHGGAVSFTGPRQYIRVPNHASLNPPALTLAAWVKTGKRDTTWRRIFDKSYSTGYALSIGGGHTSNDRYVGLAVCEIGMKENHNRGITESDAVVADDQWHFVVATFDGHEQRLYVDGILQSRSAYWEGRLPENEHDLTIGLNLVDPNPDFDEVGASFEGLMDDVMIFSRALSAEEVAFLAAQ